MSTIKLPSTPARTQDTTFELKLMCANNESVLVCSDLLRDATRSAAIKDIIDTASAGSPKELPMREDSAETWRMVWRLIQHPLATCPGLDWGNIGQVITLADKYHLISPLQACDGFIVTAVASKPQVTPDATIPFGDLINGTTKFRLELPFLELLCSVQMWNAPEVLASLYGSPLQASCAQLKEKRKALVKQLIQQGGTTTAAVQLRNEEHTLSAAVTKQVQAMREAVSSFRKSSADPEAAARVEGFIHKHMSLALEELAICCAF